MRGTNSAWCCVTASVNTPERVPIRALLPLQTSAARDLLRPGTWRDPRTPGGSSRGCSSDLDIALQIHGCGVIRQSARSALHPNGPHRDNGRLVGMEMDQHRPGDLRGTLGHHCRRTLETAAALQVGTDPDRSVTDEDRDDQLTLSDRWSVEMTSQYTPRPMTALRMRPPRRNIRHTGMSSRALTIVFVPVPCRAPAIYRLAVSQTSPRNPLASPWERAGESGCAPAPAAARQSAHPRRP